MSDDVTLTTGQTETIYGSLADAIEYLTLMFGDQYTAWLALDPDDQKRTLVGATRFIDRYVYEADADTFAKRDLIAVFPTASYELAALAADDASVLSSTEFGSNIASVSAGGAGVTYFNPSSSRDQSAPQMPDIVEKLIGGYLASGGADASGSMGQAGSCESPFSSGNSYRRNRWF